MSVSQHSERTTFPAAVERAERLWSDLETSLKTVVPRTSEWLQQQRASHQEPAQATEPSSGEQSEQSVAAQTNEPEPPPQEQTEQPVQQRDRRFGWGISVTSLPLGSAGAYLRKGVEDMLAEALGMQQRWSSPG